jgi:hypothetical protein
MNNFAWAHQLRAYCFPFLETKVDIFVLWCLSELTNVLQLRPEAHVRNPSCCRRVAPAPFSMHPCRCAAMPGRPFLCITIYMLPCRHALCCVSLCMCCHAGAPVSVPCRPRALSSYVAMPTWRFFSQNQLSATLRQ